MDTDGHSAAGVATTRAGAGRGEGERFELVVHRANAKAPREPSSSPSPLIPLPLGEGERRRMLTEFFAAFARSRVIVLQRGWRRNHTSGSGPGWELLEGFALWNSEP